MTSTEAVSFFFVILCLDHFLFQLEPTNRIKYARYKKITELVSRLTFYLDLPLKSVIETPLTESLINEVFHQQNNVN